MVDGELCFRISLAATFTLTEISLKYIFSNFCRYRNSRGFLHKLIATSYPQFSFGECHRVVILFRQGKTQQ